MMADGEGAEFQRKAAFAFSVALLALGIIVYWGWALAYDTWYPFDRGNIGIYTIYAPLICFGVIGILLFRKKRPSTT
ncbi:MAG: hypothetical protein JSU93_00385 [Methanobacteriota archaeon]|nr:MAG: hypothetical protein JSU93_00385 [Euryarchaeota archaeon]